MWLFLLGAIVISLVLLLRARIAQFEQDQRMPLSRIERVGKMYYEEWSNGDIRVRHAEDQKLNTVGLRMTISDWRAMQHDFNQFVHGLEK